MQVIDSSSNIRACVFAAAVETAQHQEKIDDIGIGVWEAYLQFDVIDFELAQLKLQFGQIRQGVLRGYLSKLGREAKDAAIYWKYGCWFYEQTTRSQVLIESQWDNTASEAGAGAIRLRAWGERADELIESLLQALQSLPVGQPPEVQRIHNAKVVICQDRRFIVRHGR